MTLLAALRAATAPCHAGLERVLDLDSDHLTKARYGKALQVLLAARSGWELELEALHPGSTGPHRRWLKEDLACLGLQPLAPADPLGLDGDTAWGLRYVLEGSALGGRVLLGRLAPMGYDEGRGARYFAGHGAATGSTWKAFLADLERSVSPDATPTVVGGAVRAFEELTRCASAHFDEGLDPR